jgi:hypothetical protein
MKPKYQENKQKELDGLVEVMLNEGVWKWVTGPEGLANGGAGTTFWNGLATGSTTPPYNLPCGGANKISTMEPRRLLT